MIVAQKVGTVTHEAEGGLEQRFGRKSIYLGGGILGIVVLILLVRFVTSGHKATPPASSGCGCEGNR